MHDEIARDLPGLPAVDHVEIRLVKHQEDLPDAPPWAIGVAFPERGMVAIAARGRDGNLNDVERTVAHELAHMALERALAPRHPPRWLNEGFAYLHASDFSMAREETLMAAAIGRRLLRMAELEAAFPAREDEASLAYAESYDFVAWLAKRSYPSLRDLLARLAAGEEIEDAALHAYGITLDALEREWQDAARSRYVWFWIGLGASLLWVVGAILLVLGWRRRRRQKRARLAQMELEEREERERRRRERGENLPN
jgi:hypothetical protein